METQRSLGKDVDGPPLASSTEERPHLIGPEAVAMTGFYFGKDRGAEHLPVDLAGHLQNGIAILLSRETTRISTLKVVVVRSVAKALSLPRMTSVSPAQHDLAVHGLE